MNKLNIFDCDDDNDDKDDDNDDNNDDDKEDDKDQRKENTGSMIFPSSLVRSGSASKKFLGFFGRLRKGRRFRAGAFFKSTCILGGPLLNKRLSPILFIFLSAEILRSEGFIGT